VATHVILIGSGLVLLSIFAGRAVSRLGAPLLLVFLGLGMLAGEDGPGSIDFDDFGVAYSIGAAALAVILFDGGLHTKTATLRVAGLPAFFLATLGVVLTAGLTGTCATWLLGVTWIEGLLVGSIVASTDAAAVFFLLHQRGTNLVRRVGSTLEVESGMNDPMAIFLTITCIELITSGTTDLSWESVREFGQIFLLQIAGGAIIGVAGGFATLALINRLELASGLYPILALSCALFLFAGADALGASGFLAAYLAGIVVGNRRHRATHLIDRFQEGAAWLCQIVMFLILGLLVTPSGLVDSALPALGIALFLILIGRPLAVVLCLLPFRFSWREQGFVAWVGLRGAVPIFLGTFPVLAELPGAMVFFEVAFVVVLTSLILQGWTISPVARALSLVLPPEPESSVRFDVDLPAGIDREMASYRVQESSAATNLHATDLFSIPGVEVVSVVRDGVMHRPGRIGRLSPGDHVLLFAPPDGMKGLDRIFGQAPPQEHQDRTAGILGEFQVPGSITLGALGRFYDVPVAEKDADVTLSRLIRNRLGRTAFPGDRVRVGEIELIVQTVEEERIVQIGLELDPPPGWRTSMKGRIGALRSWLRHRHGKPPDA